ncbi:DUF1345 domain-containing protein [Microbacterium resistens]|uniref:DUF1345 domain-containing protein n=1 Tax=Microbacterium resistens TaxID=156977 RepID=UPI001C56780A|nr:DUF1345 domain-containing protein [Microbacterium resistens]MBW1638002.1 DUF1345 domain-containing protein [Microbacterium resistens]MDA4894235.1 DUF1345 domain-containing protein [Streptomyces sp. MS2A]
MARTRNGAYPIAYSDDVRGGIAALVAAPIVVVPFVVSVVGQDRLASGSVLLAVCAMFLVSTGIYLVWTHVLFVRTAADRALRIASAQHHRPPGLLTRLLGFGAAENWAVSAAAAAIVVAIAASTTPDAGHGLLMPAIVLLTAAGAWATMVYAFALRYFRLHAGGERIAFDLDDDPRFIDFVSMSVMISAVGAISGGTPRTRAGLSAVRVHTVIAFAFNAVVVAMTVSILASLVAAAAQR